MQPWHQTPWALLTAQYSNSCCALLSSRSSNFASGSGVAIRREVGGVPAVEREVNLVVCLTLSVGSQKSGEDPGGVTGGSSTCMVICESSRQSLLRRKATSAALCGLCMFFGVQRHQLRASIPCSARAIYWRGHASPPFSTVVPPFTRESECRVPLLQRSDVVSSRSARTALAIVTSSFLASLIIFPKNSARSSQDLSQVLRS